MIPDEAVEAAARRLHAILNSPYSWDGLLPSRQDSWRNHARELLEAAAPHLMAAGERGPVVRQWDGEQWVQIVNHGWAISVVQPHNADESPVQGDIRRFDA